MLVKLPEKDVPNGMQSQINVLPLLKCGSRCEFFKSALEPSDMFLGFVKHIYLFCGGVKKKVSSDEKLKLEECHIDF